MILPPPHGGELMEDSVLIDHRYYRIKPGMVPAHLDLYEQTGFAAQTRYLGQPFAYLFTESRRGQHVGAHVAL